MPMDGNALGRQIANIITHADAPPEARQQIQSIWEQIGTAIVTHIQTQAQVAVSTTVAVTTPQGPGTGTGTGTGTIT